MINKFIDKFKSLIKENRKANTKIILQTKELEWAHIYHDSIRGKKAIEELGLNIGRWAGNYTFFYVLNRILSDYKPSSILELGLGESTKFISTYLNNYLPDTHHTVVEQSLEWSESFNSRFELSKNTEVVHCPLEKKIINGFEVNSYKEFDVKINRNFELYIVDGPFGSPRYSRYDIVSLVENFEIDNEFIILFDDSDRKGEVDTIECIVEILNTKKIKNFVDHYSGNKQVTLICSDKYKFSLTF
jgi:hypothetical protein